MLFGYKNGLTTYVVGHENMSKFLSFKSKNFGGNKHVENAEETDPFEHLTDDTLSMFKETILRVNHKSEKDQNSFISEYNINIIHPYDCETEQQMMIMNYEDIKERDRLNQMRLDAFKNGEMPKTTINDLYFSDKEDIYDKRTDEEKEKDAKDKESIDNQILEKIRKGENKVPLVTNLDKEDREAKDMSHLRREQNEDLMEDFDPDEDMIDPDELAAVMEYQEKVIHARTEEEKQKLKDELYSKLSEKTISDREEHEREVAASQKAVENEQFRKILDEELENYKNGIHKSNATLDMGHTISVDSDILSDDIKNVIPLINSNVEKISIIDLPLSSVNNGKITLPTGKVIFETGKKTIVAWQNLKSISRTSVMDITSVLYDIINDKDDCYVLYCDNTLDENNVVKGVPMLVRLQLSKVQ